jgi:Family of unknown function (DUF5989)
MLDSSRHGGSDVAPRLPRPHAYRRAQSLSCRRRRSQLRWEWPDSPRRTFRKDLDSTRGGRRRWILREFWSFLRVRKKWWLTPIVVLLLTLGLILVVTEGSALAPFIYSLF